jgi:hypothetical protein
VTLPEFSLGKGLVFGVNVNEINWSFIMLKIKLLLAIILFSTSLFATPMNMMIELFSADG